ncbi:MAG: fumarylacetoacetate hydrolase family protein [Thermodesulfobacteriota bacterium]
MALSKAKLKQAADSLLKAADKGAPIAPLSDTYAGITVDEAYQIQLLNVEHWLSQGRKVVGKKIGLTSPAMQEMFKVAEPDYGHLLDDMLVYQGQGVGCAKLLQPRIEGEIAFILKRDLEGPGVTPTDVLRATEGVAAALEIVDSRIKDWKIKIQDTVADNASSAALVVGSRLVSPQKIDLRHVGFVLNKNGRLATTGAGAAVLGSPAQSVAWLANKLGEYGIPLKAGEIVLSGAAAAAVPVQAGDSIHLYVDRLGEVGCFFC